MFFFAINFLCEIIQSVSFLQLRSRPHRGQSDAGAVAAELSVAGRRAGRRLWAAHIVRALAGHTARVLGARLVGVRGAVRWARVRVSGRAGPLAARDAGPRDPPNRGRAPQMNELQNKIH